MRKIGFEKFLQDKAIFSLPAQGFVRLSYIFKFLGRLVSSKSVLKFYFLNCVYHVVKFATLDRMSLKAY